MKRSPSFLAAMLFSSLAFGTANAVTFESAEKQTGLLELYTSEGCSSCPPADKWLSTLVEEEGLWTDFIPAAFHVDYWDYIGWEDRFADPAYTSRQRSHAREQSMRTIYTPGFFHNGKEWRQWFVRRYFDFPETDPVGKLAVDIENGNASVSFSPLQTTTDDLEVNVALLGFDLETEVKAGENKGDTLKHDFVVLGTKRGPLIQQGEQFLGMIGMPNASQTAPRFGVVVWVNAAGSQRPLQATGGWLN